MFSMIRLMAAVMAAGVLVQPCVIGAPVTLQFLHASDFEAGVPALEEIPRFSSVLNALRADFTGETFVLSSGDNYIAGPFFTASADPLAGLNGVKGRADIAILNAMGIQASCFGNHEFDDTTQLIRRLILPDPAVNYAGTRFPYLSANIDFGPDSNLASLVTQDGQEASRMGNTIAGSAILTVGGQKIGVVGATTKDLNTIANPGNVDVSMDVLGKVQAAVDALAAQGLNKIVLLSHLQDYHNEFDLASKLNGVDIIFGGGSHAVFAKQGDRVRTGDVVANTYPAVFTSPKSEPVYVVNTGSMYRYVGRLIVTFNDAGIVTTLDPRSGAYATDAQGVLDTGNVAPTPAVVEAVNSIAGILDAKDGNLFGRTSVFLDGRSAAIRSEEMNLGNLTSDAYLWFAQRTDPTTALAFQDGGGIRDSIGGFESTGGDAHPGPPLANPRVGKKFGDISQLDIENALRFNSGLSLITLTAQQLRDCVEWGVSAPGAAGRYPQVSGLAFSYIPTNEPMTYIAGSDGNPVQISAPGKRLQNLVVVHPDERQDLVVENGVLVGNPGRTFRVVTLDFMADGGDSYLPLTQATNRVDLAVAGAGTGFGVSGRQQQALAQYLKTIGVYSQPDVPASENLRMQNLALRSDVVLAPVVRRVDAQASSTRLTFRTLPGRRYGIESVETFGGPWVRLPGETQGTGALGELVDHRSSNDQRYYRIVMLP